ncbi:hypothetical protein D3C71_1836980 [compost metagenome]
MRSTRALRRRTWTRSSGNPSRFARLAYRRPSLAISSARFSDNSWSEVGLAQLAGFEEKPFEAHPASIKLAVSAMTAFIECPLAMPP